VVSGSAFTPYTYPLVSTNAQLLPWLSQLLTLFEEVEWLGFLVEYRSTSGAVTTSQALGAVYLAALYDPHDTTFGTSNQMMSTMGAVETVPSRSAILAIECAPKANVMTRYYSPLNGNLYTADTNVTSANTFSGSDNLTDRFTTHCNIIVAVEGCPTSGQKIGDLFAVAHVAVSKPRILNTNNLAAGASFLPNIQFASAAIANVTTGTLFDFAASKIFAGSNLPISWNVAGNTFNFPPGFPGIYRFVLNLNWGSGVTIPTLGYTTTTGTASGNSFPGIQNPPALTNMFQVPAPGSTSTTASLTGMFYPSIQGGSITITTTSLASTPVVYSLFVNQFGLLT
jgi:hypothetical protein